MKKMLLSLCLILASCSFPSAEAPLPVIEPETPQQKETISENQPATQPPANASVPQLSGPITVVTLGDSLTQGDGDETGRGYPGRLLDMLNATHPNSTLLNLGQSGWNSDALIQGDQGLESQLDRAVTELEKAASENRAGLALVWIGSNDLWYLYEYGGDITDEADKQDLDHFSANIDLILSRLRSTGAGVVIALLDDQSQRPIAKEGLAFTAISSDEMARMSVQAARYNEVITEKAALHGALTVDFYNTDIFTNPATLHYDGNHPNPSGYDIIAQKWFEVISFLLK